MKSWQDFWLNEGFTVFGERKTSSHFEKTGYYQFASKEGNMRLKAAIDNFIKKGKPEFTKLVQNLTGENPEESYSTVAYEKGFQFLAYLENLTGADSFQGFLREYIMTFRGQSINSMQFKTNFLDFVQKNCTKNSSEINKTIDWDKWFFGVGLPPVSMNFSGDEIYKAEGLAQDFIKGNGTVPPQFADYNTYHKIIKEIFWEEFLENIGKVTNETMEALNATYNATNETDKNLVSHWYQLCSSTYFFSDMISSKMDEFLGSIGRMKLVVNIYAALNPNNHTKAVELYQKHEPFYHPMTRNRIKDALNIR